jgi:alkylmercury lyase
MQTDGAGSLVGAALTTAETPHLMRVAGKELFAWCALDTLFIPGLLGESAEVEPTCASSGDRIRLRVAPDAIESREPAGVWASVFLPGRASRLLGPASPT